MMIEKYMNISLKLFINTKRFIGVKERKTIYYILQKFIIGKIYENLFFSYRL